MRWGVRILAAWIVASLAIAVVPVAHALDYDELEARHWYQFSNSHLDAVDPCPNNNCSYSANEGQSGVIDDWNGGAFATGYGSMGAFIAWGGGHSGYYGNEVYAFDLGTQAWVRVTEPVQNPSCNQDTGELQNGSPCAAHTYDYVDYHPGTNSFILLGSASNHNVGGDGAPVVHLFDFDTKTWRRGASNAYPGGLTGASSAYDSSRDTFWLLPSGDQAFSQYDPDANGGEGRWTTYNDYNIDIDATSAVMPGRSLFVTVDSRNQDRIVVHDLSAPTAAGVSVDTSGPTPVQTTKASGFEWDPVSNVFVGWAGGPNVYTLAPPSGDWRTGMWVWTQITPAPSNTVVPTAANDNGTYSRFRYAPSINAFLLVNANNENVYLYKLSSGVGGASVQLNADPTTVVSGGSSTLTWSSSNVTTCTASGDWSGSKSPSGSQVMSNLTANKHYALTCSGAGGSANDSADVTIGTPAPTVNLTAAPTSVVSGGSSTLTWSSTNATSCTASGDWSGSKSPSGSQVMSNLTANKHYVLTCTGSGGSEDDSADVTVTNSAPTVSLTAAPTSVSPGGSSTLTWSSTNATSCTASGDWSNNKSLSGTQVMNSITTSKHYVLSCTGAGGTTNDSADVSVLTGGGDAEADWIARSTGPGVVYAEGFDNEDAVLDNVLPDSRAEFATWSTGQHASGAGSLQFEIPSNSGANTSGNWRSNFSDDNSIKFGAGNTFYVQWRQRFDSTMLGTVFDTTDGSGGGWKQVIVGEGDYEGELEVGSCTTLELVLNNNLQRHFAQLYHGCGFFWPYQEPFMDTYFKLQNAIDAGADVTPVENRYVLYPFEPSRVTELRPGSPAMAYYANEWMTFQMRISPGPLGTDTDAVSGTEQTGFTNSTIEVWVARQGQPSVKTHSFTGAVWRRDDGAQNTDEKYGKVWLTPYHTAKDPNDVHPVSFTWYDELIVSTQRIPDPMVAGDPPPTVNLTANPTQVQSGGSSTLTWSSTNATSCTASGNWTGNKSLSGTHVVSNITANKHYVLTCTGSGGSSDDSADVTVNAAPAPTVTLTANPTSVPHGGSSTLTWSSTNATSCTASGNWSGSKSVSGTQVMSGLTSDRHYVLTCTGSGGSDADDADVDIGPAPPQVNLTADPDDVDYGEGTTLTWTATDADLCVASGDWTGSRAPSGEETIPSLEADSSFTLNCFGPNGRDNDTATVDVGPAPPLQPVITMSANPSAVDYLGSTTITWSTSNATSCTASGAWSGTRALSGSDLRGPLSVDSVFTLSCSGPGGSKTRSITVDVAAPPVPPTLTFTANPQTVPEGGRSTLTWSSTNTDGCVASGGWSGARPPNGSASTPPLNNDTQFRLSCTGSGGTVQKSVTVTVDDDTLPVPQVTFTASPLAIPYNGTTMLTWHAEHAAWCTASGAWSGVKAADGSERSRRLTSDSTFTLSCFNEAGRTNKAVTVIVAGPDDMSPVVSLSADTDWVDYGGTPTLGWSSINAEACNASGDWTGTRPLEGLETLAPLDHSTTYMLRCTSELGEAEAVVGIAVGPPDGDAWLELGGSPAEVDYYGEVQLAWATANVDSCVASGGWSGERPTSGSELVTGLIVNTTFTLFCTGPSGTVTHSVAIAVGNAATPALELTAEPDAVPYGGTAVLSWEGENVDVCIASGDWSGERIPNGIESTDALTEPSEFTLVCSGAGGTVSATEGVDVAQPSPDDSDGDGLSDEWEQIYFGDLSHDGSGDADDDGLDDRDEYSEGTDPTLWDTDEDGSSDSEEVFYGSDPRDSGDVWTAHRPERPAVDDTQTIELRDGVIGTSTPYFDPDGDGLASSDWEVATDADFEEFVLDRVVFGSEELEVPAGALDKAALYWVRTRHVDTTGLPSEWSEVRQVATAEAFPNDADGDDVDDDYQVDGFADTNIDGVDDQSQGLCNLYDAEGRSVIGFGSNDGRIRCYTSIPNGKLPDGDLYADALLYGMFSFAIDELPVNPEKPATVQVTIYLPEAPTPLSGWYKFDEANGAVTDFSAYSSVAGAWMRVNLVDGGAGDQDGVVNGVIVDPSGPAIAALPPPPTGGGGGGGGDDDPPANGSDDDEGGGGGAVELLALLLLSLSLLGRRRRAAGAY